MARKINLPGGHHAMLISEGTEWTPRRRRPLELIAARVGHLMPALQAAGRILCDGDVIEDRTGQKNEAGEPLFPGPDLDLTERQLALTSRLNDAVAWGMLLFWSLEQPIPESPEAMLDECPADVYDTLRAEAAKRVLSDPAAGFSVDAIEDPASPTGP